MNIVDCTNAPHAANDDEVRLRGGGVMVWGMSLPSSFGDFWPEGEFEEGKESDFPYRLKWSIRLSSYFEAQTPETQKALFDYVETGTHTSAQAYSSYVIGKLKSEFGTKKSPNIPPFNAIQPHEPPRTFDLKRTYKNLGSLIALNYGILAADETMKTIIEGLEPGIHHFFSIEIRMPRGKIYPVQYYVIVIRNYFDSFAKEESAKESWREFSTDDSYFHYEDSANGIRGLAFKTSVFGKAQLWRERKLGGLLTCLSDELQAAISYAGLRMPKHYKMMEV